MWKSTIGILDNNTEQIKQVCDDISAKDKSFKYSIQKASGVFINSFKDVLIIFDLSRESIDKRSGWLIHKMKNAKVGNFYIVREYRDIDYLTKYKIK